MTQGDKELLQGMAMLASVVAAVVCGVGLFFMGLDGNLSQTHFIQLGLSTLGAAMIGGVAGAFIFASMEVDKQKKEEAAKPEISQSPSAAAEDRPRQA